MKFSCKGLFSTITGWYRRIQDTKIIGKFLSCWNCKKLSKILNAVEVVGLNVGPKGLKCTKINQYR